MSSAAAAAAAAPLLFSDEKSLQTLRDVVQAVNNEEPEQVVPLCEELLAHSVSSVSSSDTTGQHDGLSSLLLLIASIRETHVQALLQCQQYDQAVAAMDRAVAAATTDDNHDDDAAAAAIRRRHGRRLSALRAYAAYKQKNYKQAVHLATAELAANAVNAASSNEEDNDSDTSSTTTTVRAMQHLLAQSLNHLADGASAVKVYRDLLLLLDGGGGNPNENDDDETVQVWTNLLAVEIANAIPYCGSAAAAEEVALVESVSAYLQHQKGNADSLLLYPYDLAYNLATLQLLTTAKASDRMPWHRLMETAASACKAAAAASSGGQEGALAGDLGPIETNETLFRRVFWNVTSAAAADTAAPTATEVVGGDGQTTPAAAAFQTVRQVNRAVLGQASPEAALKMLLAEPDATKFTVLQRRIWSYNRAVLQLHATRYDECRATCQHYFLAPQKTGKKQKKPEGSEAAVYGNPEERTFWESRATVLLAHCAAKDGKGESAATLLDACVERCNALPSSSARDHVLTYVLLHRAALAAGANGTTDSKMKLLQELLPESVRSKPAVVATMAALYQSSGHEAKAALLLQEHQQQTVNGGNNNNNNDLAVADFAMSQGNYAQAAALYETAVAAASPGDFAAKARLVRALSYTDPDRAVLLWSEMAPDLVVESDDNEVNGAELETKELHLKSSMVRRSNDAVPAETGDAKKSKKSHAAVLRQRARKREIYLAEQEKKGTSKPGTAVPDPERWLPKYERSNARRRKNRDQHKGAQGGASEKDAAKLDIVARQAARASGDAEQSGRSTAHMTVSGGARKGKSSGKRR